MLFIQTGNAIIQSFIISNPCSYSREGKNLKNIKWKKKPVRFILLPVEYLSAGNDKKR